MIRKDDYVLGIISADGEETALRAGTPGKDDYVVEARCADGKTGAFRLDPLDEQHETGLVAETADGESAGLIEPSQDGTIWKLSNSGRLIWAYDTVGPVVPDVKVDADGNVYACGSADAEGKNLWKLTPAGKLIWKAQAIENASGGEYYQATALAVDSAKNVYVLLNRDSSGICIVKFDPDGNRVDGWLFVRDVQIGWDLIYSDGYLYVTGRGTWAQGYPTMKIECVSAALMWSADIRDPPINGGSGDPAWNGVALTDDDTYLYVAIEVHYELAIAGVHKSTGVQDRSKDYVDGELTRAYRDGIGIDSQGNLLCAGGDGDETEAIWSIGPEMTPNWTVTPADPGNGSFKDIKADSNDDVAVAGTRTSSPNASVRKLAKADGATIWTFDTGGSTVGLVIDGEDNIIVSGYRVIAG